MFTDLIMNEIDEEMEEQIKVSLSERKRWVILLLIKLNNVNFNFLFRDICQIDFIYKLF